MLTSVFADDEACKKLCGGSDFIVEFIVKIDMSIALHREETLSECLDAIDIR